MFAVQADGCEITTIEGLSPADGSLNPVQEAFRDCHGLQCGFCTPGFVVSVTALLRRQPRADRGRTARRAGRQPVPVHRLPGHRRRGATGRVPGRGARMTQQLTRPAQPVETAKAARFVGQSVRRREDPRLLTGRGRYVDDVTMPRMLHAHFVRSPVARGTLDGLDVAAARELPGVHAVLTAADVNPQARSMWNSMMGPDGGGPPPRVLADGDVRYVGEPIAIVIAQSRALAEDAADLVVFDVEPGTPVVTIAQGARPGRAGAPGARLELLGRARAGRPAATGAAVRVGRARDLRALHAAPLRLRADGATRPRGGLGSVGRDARGRRVDADRARVASSLVAAARRARGRRSGRHGRRRRQLRAEDVPRRARTTPSSSRRSCSAGR